MESGIYKSVGHKGANEKRDVKLIQSYLNAFSINKKLTFSLKVDGIIGKKTVTAIKTFQKDATGMKYPDGRVDPGGRTYRYLTMYIPKSEQARAEKNINKTSVTKPVVAVTPAVIRDNAGLSNYTVSYKSSVKESRKIVSTYAIDIIKLALKESGATKAVITSTLRTPEEQAAIMLKNAKINLKKQYRLYGRNGDKVLKIYENNKSKADDKIKALMVTEIESLAKDSKRVSKHCVSVADYKKLNIIDIGLNSTKNVNLNFDTTAFTKALKSLQEEGYIKKFIDETGKSNQCWHVEIVPNIKGIIEYNKSSILNQFTYINGLLA